MFSYFSKFATLPENANVNTTRGIKQESEMNNIFFTKQKQLFQALLKLCGLK